MDELKQNVKVSTSVARARLHSLMDLEQMLGSFYDFYNHEVDSPYLVVEQNLIVRLIRLMISQLQEKTQLQKRNQLQDNAVSDNGIPKSTDGLKCVRFRFVLPEQNPFSVDARFFCLRQLEGYLICFFDISGCRSTGIPYSVTEQQVLKRIRKIFVHQLWGTDKYRMFKKKCPSYAARITPKEKQERLDIQKDEKLLKVVNGKITKINPHSKKYKALKEELLRKIQQMD